MKRNLIIVLIIIISQVFAGCFKKSQEDLATEQFKISENSSVNMEIKNLKEALKSAGTDVEKAEINTKIAVVLDEKGDVSSMIKAATEAIKFQPNQYMSHYLLGNMSINFKKDFAPAWFEMGNAQYKKLNYPLAKDAYKKAISFDKNMIDAHNNMGVLSTLSGDLNGAEKYLKTCVALNPEYAMAYKNLGILYDTKMKKGPAAVENYTKYLALRPDSPDRRLVKLWIAAIGG